MKCEIHNFNFEKEIYPNGCPICLSEEITKNNLDYIKTKSGKYIERK